MVAVDHQARSIQYVLGGAVILLQQDLLTVREILFEALHVAVIRAAPAVDGLVFIAHHEDVVMIRRKMLEQLVLRQVGILEFIHQHMLEAPGVLLCYAGMLLQQAGSQQQQVIEVHSIVGFAAFPGSGYRRARRPRHGRCRTGMSPGSSRSFLAAEMAAWMPEGRWIFSSMFKLADSALDQRFLVIGVENDEIGLIWQVIGFAAQ